jgi:hypothetical protein
VRRHHWRVVRRPASSPTRLRALADGALRSRNEPSGAAALLCAAASTMLEARAEHRPGVRQLEHVARAASQLSHKLAPPARRPCVPARKQRGVAELCCAHLSDVQVWVVVGVVGGRSKFRKAFRSATCFYLVYAFVVGKQPRKRRNVVEGTDGGFYIRSSSSPHCKRRAARVT